MGVLATILQEPNHPECNAHRRSGVPAHPARAGGRGAVSGVRDRPGQLPQLAPPSRGYREEMEHLAYCIRMREEGMQIPASLFQKSEQEA